MAESRREREEAAQETQTSNDGKTTSPAAGTAQSGAGAVHEQAERIAQVGTEGMRQAADASATAAGGMLNSGSAVASGAQEITAAWARYAEEVMRHTSEASQALLRARSFTDMLEVQAKLLRDNMQAFLDQSVAITEAASRMATRPFEAIRNTGADQPRR